MDPMLPGSGVAPGKHPRGFNHSLGLFTVAHSTTTLITKGYYVPHRRKMDATDLTIGAELDTRYDETLVVTDVSDDELTWEVDGDATETFSIQAVQQSLDDGDISVVGRGRGATGEDAASGHGTMEIADVSPADVDDELYIRFGTPPEDERSYDNRNDRVEDGVSVYACSEDDGVYLPTGQMVQTVFALMHRDTYLVTGERVGTGADGEPLLRDVEAVAELSSPKGVEGWIVDE